MIARGAPYKQAYLLAQFYAVFSILRFFLCYYSRLFFLSLHFYFTVLFIILLYTLSSVIKNPNAQLLEALLLDVSIYRLCPIDISTN